MKNYRALNRFFIIYFLFFLLPVFCFAKEHYITIVAITQKDHQYLAEWIDYHVLVGADHFCIYDNNDDDQTRDVLEPYISSGLVEYIKWPNLWKNIPFVNPGGCQVRAYGDALKKYTTKTDWIAFIDIDEFIVPTNYITLKETLIKGYDYKNLIYVNWRIFGTSGLHLTPPTLILPYLTKCSARQHHWNKWGKVIARPEYLKTMEGLHIGDTDDIYFDGSGNPFPYTTWQQIYDNQYLVHDDLLRVNHYTFRDEWFFLNVKVPRICENCWNTSPNFIEQECQKNQEYSVEECYRILDIINMNRPN